MTIRTLAEAAVVSQVEPELVTMVSHSPAIPWCHHRSQAQRGRQPPGWGRAQGSIFKTVNLFLQAPPTPVSVLWFSRCLPGRTTDQAFPSPPALPCLQDTKSVAAHTAAAPEGWPVHPEGSCQGARG